DANVRREELAELREPGDSVDFSLVLRRRQRRGDLAEPPLHRARRVEERLIGEVPDEDGRDDDDDGGAVRSHHQEREASAERYITQARAARTWRGAFSDRPPRIAPPASCRRRAPRR